MDKKTAIIIGAVGLVMAFIIGILAVFVVFRGTDKSENEQTTAVIEESARPYEDDILTTEKEPETVVIVETTEIYVEAPESEADSNNNSNNNGSSSENTRIIEGDRYYIVMNTPDNAGLVMRDAPTKDSDKLGVVPEGARVYVYSDDASNNTGYVRVLVSEELRDVHCYVLRDYLWYDNSHIYVDSDNDNMKKAHVSYNVPDYAGLNLREEPDSKSALIEVLECGEIVEIADGKTVNGYIKVHYDHPHAGQVYEGWLLEKYLVY